MPHLCTVCQADDWHPLDTITVICPQCQGQRMVSTGPETRATCPLCKGNGRINFQLRDKQFWFDRNYIYDEEIGMKVCKSCGFVTYTPRWDEAALRAKYTKNRELALSPLLIRGNIKNAFHEKFIGTERRYSACSVLDIGCAFGSVADIFPNADIYGIEYAAGLAQYAKNVNGVNLIEKTQDLADASMDLVMIYHTLEHTMDARATLLEAKRVLKPGGHLYIAVPDYLGTLREVSGMDCTNFELLYHPDHHNVFSHKSFNNLLRQCGFEVIQSDNFYYGEAVLCKVNDQIEKFIEREDWPAIEGILYRQRMAMQILSAAIGNHDSEQAVMQIEAALANYPAYVDAYLALMVQKEQYKNPAQVREVYLRGLKNCGENCYRLHQRYAQILANWCDQGKINNFLREAEKIFVDIAEKVPGDPDALMNLMKIYAHHYKDRPKAVEYGRRLLAINPQAWADVQNILATLYCEEQKASE